ncbi:UDP-N-acetylmuramoyl-L-alanine--D-glutamate ligase [Glaciihabitans sp. dw_435]|uniref:UDP-N-acetylmuramoyl-L-alanine--D-glutamate ligase n=1 Tax=Glaciihabitans sp. dw_435 TaxID=2720081 RepID=UPI001BD5B611|nr:UDP-N-acetylmuramoyl-L-alanine--D-glutamate ligase [Glaciihabitans sp. dw_435]
MPSSDSLAGFGTEADATGLAGLAGARVLILGTGREGVAAADAILSAGTAASVVAADDKDGASAIAWREKYGPGIDVLIAPRPEDLVGRVDVVVKSPGISPGHPLVSVLTAVGLRITSGTDLWMAANFATTTGITGSKGKSTTASLIHHLTNALGGRSVLGGNIGVPLLALGPAPRTVVELSSYQCQSLTISPDVAVLTSLFAEHLDWHGSEENYYADKLNLIGHSPRRVILNAEDADLLAAVTRLHPDVEFESVGADHRWGVREHDGSDWIMRGDEPIMPRERLRLLGRHNALNACLALAAVEAAGIEVDATAAASALEQFLPLEHRLEPIADPSGLTFVNDSLSTSPFATIEALKAFASPDVTLIVGGQDRGVDYTPLADFLAGHPVSAVVGLPPSGPRILATMDGLDLHRELADDMLDAVTRARALTPAAGTVLLSPGAPSYGIYRDFADRADDFRRVIAATIPPDLPDEKSTS